MYRGDTRLRTEEHTSPALMAILEMASECDVTMAKYIGDHLTGELSTGREPWVNRMPQLMTVRLPISCHINLHERMWHQRLRGGWTLGF